MVLVDTSVLIEYFSLSPRHELTYLDQLILEKQIATCLPIMAEVLSGEMNNNTKRIIREAFKEMIFVDSDWSSIHTWDEISSLAKIVKSKKVGIPGIVDRMIILSAKEANIGIWSFDKKLNVFAKALEAPIYHH